MSGAEPPLVVLPAALDDLLGALAALAAPDLPAIALIGGMAVNIRLSTSADTHRATRDIDVVSEDEIPATIEVLARDHQLIGEHTARVHGIDIDVIVTQAVTDDDLDGLDDGARLFVAGHRWALESAEPVRLTSSSRSGQPVTIRVATAAGLVAAKSHAAGYPTVRRRETKHGGDLYDIFRLIEEFDRTGQLRSTLANAPGDLRRVIADVVRREIMTSPTRAAQTMSISSAGRLQAHRIIDTIAPFLAGLDLTSP